MCLLKYMYMQLQLGCCIHSYTNETQTLAPLQDLIPTTLHHYITRKQQTHAALHHDVKLGIKSCRGARECVSLVHVYYVATQFQFYT